MRGAIVVGFALIGAGCTSSENAASEEDASEPFDASTGDADETSAIDSGTDSGVDPDADIEDIDLPETSPRPDAAGWCLSRGAKWPCEKGGACTFDGHCVPPDSGGEGGIKPCGAIGCDPEWCTCINAPGNTCDCTP